MPRLLLFRDSSREAAFLAIIESCRGALAQGRIALHAVVKPSPSRSSSSFHVIWHENNADLIVAYIVACPSSRPLPSSLRITGCFANERTIKRRCSWSSEHSRPRRLMMRIHDRLDN